MARDDVGYCHLSATAAHGQCHVIDLLLDHDSRIDARSARSPISPIIVVMNREYSTIAILLERGHDVNAQRDVLMRPPSLPCVPVITSRCILLLIHDRLSLNSSTKIVYQSRTNAPVESSKSWPTRKNLVLLGNAGGSKEGKHSLHYCDQWKIKGLRWIHKLIHTSITPRSSSIFEWAAIIAMLLSPG